MIKVNCEACGAPYDVDPRRIPASGLKMRCPGCGTTFHVHPPGGTPAQKSAAQDALDLDLPAPKGAFAVRTKGHAATPTEGPARGQRNAHAPSLPENLANDLEPTGPGRIVRGGPSDDFDLDLPSPKGFDLDLPAPKTSAGLGPLLKKPGLREPTAPTQPVATPSGKLNPGASQRRETLDLDLPAPKPQSPTGFTPSKPGGPRQPIAPSFGAAASVPSAVENSFGDLDLDLPMAKPKAPAPAGSAGATIPAKKPIAPSVELDLPALKGAPNQANTAAVRAPVAPDFELDLPAVKGVQARANQAPAKAPLAPDFELDLPMAKGAPSPARPAASTGAQLPELDMPQGAGTSASKGAFADLDFDLPAPKGGPATSSAGGFGGFDLDLPAFKDEPRAEPSGVVDKTPAAGKKSGAAAGAPKSFSRPQAGAESRPAKLGSLPKDSLALDPSPLYAGNRASGPLGDLDEVNIFGAAPQPEHVDLPAPSNLPAVKRGGPAATMLGLGHPGKMARDSLDMPRGFEGASEPVVFEDSHGLLPAPADLPKIKPEPKAAKADPRPLAKPGPDLGGLDLPAPADLPARMPQKQQKAAPELDDLDLPAPGDLPARKKAPPGGATMLGLGQSAKGPLTASAEKSAAAKPTGGIGELLDDSLSKAGAPEQSDTFGGFDFELDLPPPTRQAQDASGPIELEKLSLPPADGSRGGFGATMALGADDIELGAPGGLSIPGLEDDDPFRGIGRSPSNNQTIELDSVDFGSPARKRAANDARSNSAFGELDFGLDNGPKTGGLPLVQPRPMPMPVPQTSVDTKPVEAELLGEAETADSALRKKKKKARRDGPGIPGYVWPILMVLAIGATGVGLGMFSNHGYFGVYLLEQLLPAAGDPGQVAAAIGQAEKVARSDTYLDVRKSLAVLSDARNEAGLNRRLLSRSLLNEALYQLRFGEDAQSAQRSVAILARVMERGADAEGLTLARAADAARRGDLSGASALLAQVPVDNDPYRALVAGELALLQRQPQAALQAFEQATKLNAGARATWGAARAAITLGKLDDAEASARQTLSESPVHAAALTFMARRALTRGDTALALDYTRKATGAVKVGEERARPSRKDRAEAYGLTGQIEQLLDHPLEAQAAYEASLTSDPLRVDSLIGSGTMLMRLGRARDALSRFDSALQAHPGTTPDALGKIPLIEAGVGAVQALLLLERASEALPRATELAGQFPDDPLVTLWLGHSYEAAEKWPEAEAAFSKTIEQSPSSFAGYVALSQMLFKKNRPEEGARVLSDASGKVKDSAEVRRMLGHSELTRNHLPEAIHHFQASLRFDENDSGALLGLVTAQRKSGDIAAAEKTLAKLEKVDPSLAGLPLERGQLLESRGDYSAASDAYRKALEARPHDTDLKLRLGAALVTAGRLDEAEAILPEVLKERPTSAEAEHFVGRLLFAKKETAQAVQHFERSIAFDSLRAEYHLYLAWAYLDQNNIGAALSSVNKSLERDPNLGDARWVLGRIQLRTGAVKDALASFQQTLKLKPGRVEALANMGDAYDQLRDLAGAIRSYQEAVKQMPENGDWWFRLGTLHLDKGSRDEARVALAEAVLRGDRLIEKPTWLADAHRLYGDVLRESGRTGEALENYRVYLQLAPASHADRSEIERIVRSGQR